MTKKRMAVLALVLAAPAVFGQTVVPAVHAQKVKPAAAAKPAAGQMKELRQEIKQDKSDMAAKTKASRAERRELVVQLKAELAKVRGTVGTRAEKAQARKALREKYARLMQDARSKAVFQRRNLNEDITGKSGLIKKLRQS
jgi:hypothetical protein